MVNRIRFLLPFVCLCLLIACAPAAEPIVEAATPLASTPATKPTPTAVAPASESDAGALAYVQNNALYIQNSGQPPLAIDHCPTEETGCLIHYLTWSPDNQWLLYYYHDSAGAASLRLANRQGNVQTVAEDILYLMPGAWSPDSAAILYLDPASPAADGAAVNLHEVRTVAVAADGQLGARQSQGQLQRRPDGCGGGGRSASQVLYENEGGTAYGYLMGVMEWTAPDIVLYTEDCTNQTTGRFDLAGQAQLSPFDRPVRNLVMANDNNRWFGVGGPSWSTEPADHQLVTGRADETSVTPIPTSTPAELVFFGPVTGTLYYTTMTPSETPEELPNGGSFTFNTVSLHRLNPDGSDEITLWQGDSQAIALDFGIS